jgi:hypothetical protein
MTRFGIQISAAKTTLARLNNEVNSGTLSSAELQGLIPVQRTAQTQLRTATRGYNLATLALDAAKKETPTYRMIDKPALPAPAVSGMKKSVMMVFAGMFVGFLTGSESKAGSDELRDVVAQAHSDPVPLERDAVKGSNGNGAGAQESAPKKAERAG